MAEVSKSGVWIDQATGQVVTDPPERGTQLVAPGYPIDDRAARVIEAAKAAAPDTPKRAPVEHATAPKAAEKRAKK
jgi:hypothetical protein